MVSTRRRPKSALGPATIGSVEPQEWRPLKVAVTESPEAAWPALRAIWCDPSREGDARLMGIALLEDAMYRHPELFVERLAELVDECPAAAWYVAQAFVGDLPDEPAINRFRELQRRVQDELVARGELSTSGRVLGTDTLFAVLVEVARVEFAEAATYLRRAGHVDVDVRVLPPDRLEAIAVELSCALAGRRDRELVATVTVDPSRVGFVVTAEVAGYNALTADDDWSSEVGVGRVGADDQAVQETRRLARAAWVELRERLKSEPPASHRPAPPAGP